MKFIFGNNCFRNKQTTIIVVLFILVIVKLLSIKYMGLIPEQWNMVSMVNRWTVGRKPTRTIAVAAPDEMEGYGKVTKMVVPTWSDLHSQLFYIRHGGRYKPSKTKASHKLTIIVPYRDRRVHLKLFLKHMHPFLQRQNLDYVIYVVEMESEGLFRKTVIMNAAFLEVRKREQTSCVIFHDVDMLPTNEDNFYYCDNTVRHYGVALQQYGYRLFYPSFIGGVISFPTKYYKAVNGFSNLYSGWGGEDDDMYERIKGRHIPFSRQNPVLGRYDTLDHVRQPDMDNREELLNTARRRMKSDGLNSVKYRVHVVEERPLFTWILIQANLTADSAENFQPIHIVNKFRAFQRR